MSFQPKTNRLIGRDIGKAVAIVLALAILGYIFSWPAAFAVLAVIHIRASLALFAAVGLMFEQRADAVMREAEKQADRQLAQSLARDLAEWHKHNVGPIRRRQQ